MKNTYKLLVAFVAILGFWSCDNETDLMILEPQEADFAIITPDAGSKVILNKATPDNTALTLTWEKVSYGTPTIVTYTVEFAKSGTDFIIKQTYDSQIFTGAINSGRLPCLRP